MITNDIIEIQKDSTYTFSVFKENKNISIIPSTAFIIILDSFGSELLASTAMTINATTGLCTYNWNSTGNEVGLNYIVKFNIDSDKSLYLIFALYNRKIKKAQKLTYCVKSRTLQFTLHDEHLYLINE